MKKVPVYDLKGKVVKEVTLPEQFSFEYRPDLINRAFLAIMSHKRQPYGADVMAGKRTSAEYRGRRRAYGTWANRGFARLPRIRVGSGHLVGTVRFVPHAVKGRKAHPPKAEKIWYQKINKKERLKAMLSAISSSSIKELVTNRGHRVEDIKDLPIVVVGDIEKISKTKELENILINLKLENELRRAKNKSIRAGKGKMRGRKYKKKRSALIIVSDKSKIEKAARNIAGVDVVTTSNLNVELLAPGGHAARLTIWSELALKELEEKRLFMVV